MAGTCALAPHARPPPTQAHPLALGEGGLRGPEALLAQRGADHNRLNASNGARRHGVGRRAGSVAGGGAPLRKAAQGKAEEGEEGIEGLGTKLARGDGVENGVHGPRTVREKCVV